MTTITPMSAPAAKDTLAARIRRFTPHRSLLIGSIGLGTIILIAILAQLISWHDPFEQNLMARRLPPVWYGWFWDDPNAGWLHPLGTDRLGRDYWSRLIHGARVSLLIGISVVIVSGIIGTTLGVLAGYFGGYVDMVVSFLITTRLAMPVILVALAAVALLDASLLVITLVLGLLLWDRFAVVVRSATMQARSMEYVTAAQAIGCSPARIILTEILPNLAAPLTVIATIEMATAILYEAALSFLGLGVQPPTPSWGLMLAEAKDEIFFAPWMITLPGLALFILLLSINLFGDGVRDVTATEGRS